MLPGKPLRARSGALRACVFSALILTAPLAKAHALD
jgi:hypothetical protein